MTPSTIGRYRIVRRLGAGGMGEVYLAEDPFLKRQVAIKVLTAATGDDEAADARLVREAQAAATLDHPNVCAVYEIGEVDGRHYIAMQYIEGETLAQRLAREALPRDEAIRVASLLADALTEAHARGIVHRDIKPGNIMLSGRGLVKLLDFGLAKLLPLAGASGTQVDTAPVITAAGAIAGTTGYMSPEQLRGEPIDGRSDVFSLGCVIHEMLTRRHPFTRASAAATVAAILAEAPPPLPTDAPPDLQRIVRKCLEKDRDRRYASTGDLAVDLRSLGRETHDTAAAAGRRRLLAGAAVVLVAALGTAWWLAFGWEAATDDVRVLAILPLVDPSSQYLGDGISESVINSLSQLPELKVLARTTTFRYRGANVDLAALAGLGVDAVVTGRVEHQGDALVVQAELTRTSDGSQIWGQRYSNRRLTDVFAVQEAIARDIAGGLRLELAGRDDGSSRRETDNVEAYRIYLLGRQYAQTRALPDLQAAMEQYRRAIALDERYALAWAGLADVYVVLSTRGAIPPAEGRRLAREAAERAVTIAPDLAEAYAAVGQTHIYLAPYDFAAGDRALRRALELNPGWALVHQYIGVSLLEQGRLQEGLRELQRGHELDPLSGFMTRLLALAHTLNGDDVTAMTLYRSAASAGPAFSTIFEAEFHVRAGAIDEGLAEIARSGVARSDDPYIRFSRAMLLGAKGDRTSALVVAREFDEQSIANPALANFAGRIYVTLGDYDRGLAMLRRSVDGGGAGIFYKDQPLWRPIRRDPRFLALLQRMGIPD